MKSAASSVRLRKSSTASTGESGVSCRPCRPPSPPPAVTSPSASRACCAARMARRFRTSRPGRPTWCWPPSGDGRGVHCRGRKRHDEGQTTRPVGAGGVCVCRSAVGEAAACAAVQGVGVGPCYRIYHGERRPHSAGVPHSRAGAIHGRAEGRGATLEAVLDRLDGMKRGPDPWE